MGMPLRQWDVEVAPILRDIQHQSEWASHHARRISNLIHRLGIIPAFESMAKDEMERALADLKSATSALSDAIAMYDGLPIDE